MKKIIEIVKTNKSKFIKGALIGVAVVTSLLVAGKLLLNKQTDEEEEAFEEPTDSTGMDDSE